jgi:hydroxymethylpyrimidine/phosphomethylpyrimidine kinase
MQHSPSRRAISVLSIAGSDSGGGAGIQADLKTFAAFGLHGLTAITAVTAQNTRRVASIMQVPARELLSQLEALFDDFDIRAVKIGMLGSRANISAVSDFLRQRAIKNVVLDPVLVASSGTRLLPAGSVAALREELIPLADLITPNLPEAHVLLGDDAQGADAARRLLALGARAVLLKGGHASGDVVRDFLATSRGVREFRHARRLHDAHGTGCVLASAIAAHLARGDQMASAVVGAEKYLQKALASSYRAGKSSTRLLGHRPTTNISRRRR